MNYHKQFFPKQPLIQKGWPCPFKTSSVVQNVVLQYCCPKTLLYYCLFKLCVVILLILEHLFFTYFRQKTFRQNHPQKTILTKSRRLNASELLASKESRIKSTAICTEEKTLQRKRQRV